MNKYICIIPARGGSKGIPRKNICMLEGHPLIAWTIKQALTCEQLGRVIVSTDDSEIAEIAQEAGAEVPFMRPESLATDESPTEPVIIHAIKELYKPGNYPEAVMLLQPTSPIRKPGRLKQAITLFDQSRADSLVSVTESHVYFWKNRISPTPLYDFHNRPRRQDVFPEAQMFQENGSIYITKTDLLLKEKNRLGGKIVMFPMDEEEGWDIDSVTDFSIAGHLIKASDLHLNLWR